VGQGPNLTQSVIALHMFIRHKRHLIPSIKFRKCSSVTDGRANKNKLLYGIASPVTVSTADALSGAA